MKRSITSETENMYRNLFNSSKDAILIEKADGQVVEANPAACKLFGYSHKEWTNITAENLVTRADRDIIHSLTKTRPDEIELILHLVKKNGDNFVAEVRANRVNSENDETVFVFIRDLTDQKELLSALQKSEANFQNLIENLADAVFAHDIEGNLVMVNQISCENTGYTRDELLNMTVADIDAGSVERDDRTLFWQKLKPGEHVRFEVKHRRKDGSVYPAEINLNLVELGGKNIWLAVVRDMSDRKKAEDKIKDSEDRLSLAIKATGAQVYDVAVDSDDKDMLRTALCNLLGYSKDDLPSKEKLFDWIGSQIFEEDIEELTKSYQKFINREIDHMIFDFRIRDINDKIRFIRSESVPKEFNEKGEVVRIVGLIMDITQRKNLENELFKSEKLESIGILAGGIAHDFNNILVAILGNISLAQMGLEEDSEPFIVLREAEKAAERAKDLTRQLLTFSKGGAPVKSDSDLIELIKETAAFSLRGSKIQCEYNFESDLNAVEIDQGQFSQVINNLIINAIQAMPQGGKITISTRNVSITNKSRLPLPEGGYIRVVIKDEGPGISQDVINNIFDPFFTTKPKGSGLGLASTYSIVRQHDGYIEVESEPGKGAKFIIYLPSLGKRITRVNNTRADLSHGNGRILVVDDEANIRKLTQVILTHIGYKVQTAVNADEVMDVYQKNLDEGKPFDLVILDLTIPGSKGGLEILRDLQRINPRIKAIVSSGYSTDPVLADCEKYGFVGQVAKPYNAAELGRAVMQALQS